MRLLCKRGCGILLSLCLLFTPAIVYIARRMGTNQQILVRHMTRGDNPVINYQPLSTQELSQLQLLDVVQSHPSLMPRGGRGERGEAGKRGQQPVWKGRESFRYAEIKRLQQLFPLSDDFSLPNPQITLPISDIDNSQWMASLRNHLSNLSGRKIINLVTSNTLYQDVLLNWLISATVRSRLELGSILVVAMDGSLDTRLRSHGIPCVYVPLLRLVHKDTNFTKPFEKVMMLRLSVMRIISHWGFDVHNYDTDAVLLRNPQPLYNRFIDSDIIGSVGRIPAHLMMKWGITICIGVVIIRSSHLTEQYWQAMSGACVSSQDDQEKLNCGLDVLNMTWENARANQNITTVHGQCGNGLKVTVLPFSHICRLATCDPSQRDSYAIWHKGGSRSRREKLKGSRDGRTWFLRYKWNSIETASNLQGTKWLESICYWQATHT